MKTTEKRFVGYVLTVALLAGVTSAYAQTLTIDNNGKKTSIKSDGNRATISTNERSGAGQRTRITTGGSAGNGGKAVTVVQNGKQLTYDLTGGTLTVSGNNNDIVVRGKCNQLTVNGNGNTVRLESVGAISAMGNRNQIKWHNGDPEVSDLGSANSVSRD